MKKRKVGPIGSFILGAIFTVVAIIFLYVSAWPSYKAAKESINWPHVTGTVVESKIIKVLSLKNKRKKQKHKSTMYRGHIRYSYKIDGRLNHSSSVHAGKSVSSSSDPSDARELINRYPLNSSVKVFYSKSDPSNALLEPGVKTTHYIFLAVVGSFLLIGVLMLMAGGLKLTIVGASITIALWPRYLKRRALRNRAQLDISLNLRLKLKK